VIRLMIDDLPTFDLPIKQYSGNGVSGHWLASL